MLSLNYTTPDETLRAIARRVRTLRIARGWTQKEMAERSDIRLPTYRRFEHTGEVSLKRLLKIALVLDALDGFDAVFPQTAATSLDELERLDDAGTRQRGRRQDEKA